MEPGITNRYAEATEVEACRRYAIPRAAVRKIDAFESFVYEFTRAGARYILRVGHTLHRSVEAVHAELDWIEHLARRGADVARPIPSASGALVELIADGRGGHFLATAFAYAPGEKPRDAAHVRSIAEAYGQAIGRMHALTKNYAPSDPVSVRLHILDDIERHVRQWLPTAHEVCLDRFNVLMTHLRSLPAGSDAYGLVHGDAHRWNFHVDRRGIPRFFDFDDCGYAWFAYDLAVIVYCSVAESDSPDVVEEYLVRFFRGYARENALDWSWLLEMPRFLKLREIYDYTAIHRSLDVHNLSEPWASFMDGRKERIEMDTLVLDVDFSALAGLL
jgi:Ser/Thr protein kinase RdoA (MazF antagonist)